MQSCPLLKPFGDLKFCENVVSKLSDWLVCNNHWNKTFYKGPPFEFLVDYKLKNIKGGDPYKMSRINVLHSCWNFAQFKKNKHVAKIWSVSSSKNKKSMQFSVFRNIWKILLLTDKDWWDFNICGTVFFSNWIRVLASCPAQAEARVAYPRPLRPKLRSAVIFSKKTQNPGFLVKNWDCGWLWGVRYGEKLWFQCHKV